MKNHIITFLIYFVFQTTFLSLLYYFIEDEVKVGSIIIQSIFFALVMTFFMNWYKKKGEVEKEN